MIELQTIEEIEKSRKYCYWSFVSNILLMLLFGFIYSFFDVASISLVATIVFAALAILWVIDIRYLDLKRLIMYGDERK